MSNHGFLTCPCDACRDDRRSLARCLILVLIVVALATVGMSII